MLAIRHFLTSLLMMFIILGVAFGQIEKANSGSTAVPVTVATSGEHLRFTAAGNVVRMQLEVLSESGQIVFDVSSKGNVIDWTLQDGAGHRLVNGTYLCAVTVKSVSGKLNQKIGTVTIQEQQVSVGQTSAGQLTAAQEQAIGPIESDSALSVVEAGDAPEATVLAHNGTEGQIIRSTGALSFRLGDFFSGKDREQMRLTAEGNFGIGITNPQAKLDVDGMIRASQGIVFPDGSIQFSAARRTFGTASAKPGQFGEHGIEGQGEDAPIKPAISGSGTTGKIPKWQDGPAGILTDSVIVESGGSIGINTTPNTTYKLDVLGHNRFRGSNVSFYLTGSKATGNEWLFQTIDADGRLRIFENSTGGGEKLSLQQNGNVGIGTPSPQQNLSVNGGLNVDQAGVNAGSFNPGITFGSFSGEGISSKRNPGGTQFGLDFYTNGSNRMTILNNGNVGVGTTAPGAPLEVQVAGSQSLQFRQDSGLVPGINVKTTGGNAGIMRLRNAVEVWPSDDGTRAGHVDVRNTSGAPTISLDGQTGNLDISGNLTTNNTAGVRFNQAHCNNLGCAITVGPGSSYTTDTISVSVPAAGFLFISAFETISNLGSPINDVEFNLFQCADTNCNSSSLLSGTNPKALVSSAHISWVIEVTGAGFVTLRTNGVSHNSSGDVHIFDHNLTAIYLSRGY